MSGIAAVEVDPDSSEELPQGTQLLSGQYTIDSYLNHGGFGITYLATDSLSRQVVIKECFPGTLCRRSRLAVQPRSRAHVKDLQSVVRLFVKEARSLSKLEHPNIVGVHQVFEDHGTAYMALDYVKGTDLLSFIEDRKKRLSPDQVKAVLGKLLDAVRFVHDAGLLHRDISPDNIILTEALEPILIDFGAAREQATKTTQALSALRVVKDGYSPQEFYLAGSTQAPSSDLYSLAATFYHLIAGEAPPDSQLRITSHVAQQDDPYVPLGKRTTEFDANFCAAIDRALAILPQDRVQSAAEWKHLLTVKPAQKPTPAVEEAAAAPKPKKKSRQIKRETASISKPRRKVASKGGLRRHVPALLMGGAAALVLVGGALLAPEDGDAPASAPEVSVAVSAEVAPVAPEVTAPVAPQPELATVTENAAIETAAVTATVPAAAPQTAAPELVIDPAAFATIWADGLIRFDWRVDHAIEMGDDATVTTATDMIPLGARITAVNDEPVTDRAGFEAAVQRSAGASDGAVAPLSVSWIEAEGSAEIVTELPARIVYHTVFDNGLAFDTLYADDAWVTKVVQAPAGQNMELQVGDEIVALVPDNERIAGGASLAEITTKALTDDRADLQFAVRRNDALWIADLSVVAEQG